ncbi:hypothetical protein GCM10009665_06650 [Kitasatospora nipponensis]|uniref:Uncharacterized protein n=1 Tax=Kitasatospora nipponensis TaxID=258049 RepID=A0ABN1VPY2_9ACTN
MQHHGEAPQMATCTRCRSVIERTPYPSGACFGWPCHARARPEAAARLELFLRPGLDAVLPGTQQSAETGEQAQLSKPRRPAKLSRRRHSPARIRGEAVAAPLSQFGHAGRVQGDD